MTTEHKQFIAFIESLTTEELDYITNIVNREVYMDIEDAETDSDYSEIFPDLKEIERKLTLNLF